MSEYTAEADRLITEARRSVTIEKQDAAAATELTASHLYRTDIDDLWNAIVDPQRLARWFGPVSGDFRVGGSYAVEGNASGTIRTCDAPTGFTATWEFMGGTSELTVTLAPEGDATRLTLQHSGEVPYEFYDQFGPGATGVGWDNALPGLAAYLAFDTEAPVESTEWATSSEGLAFIRSSATAWGDAAVAAGEPDEVARASAERTAAFFSGAGQV